MNCRKRNLCERHLRSSLPVRLRNDYVKLDTEMEQALSPTRHLQHLLAKVVVCCGELESDEFRRQSREFALAIGASLAAPYVELKGLNHFEVAETLADPNHGLGLHALNLMQNRR